MHAIFSSADVCMRVWHANNNELNERRQLKSQLYIAGIEFRLVITLLVEPRIS
jgi:hypothetical protein